MRDLDLLVSFIMPISPAQSRGARAFLNWSQDQLAQAAGVARATIVDFEGVVRTPMRNNLISITNALEAAGIAFIEENGEGAGIRFQRVEIEYNNQLFPHEDGVKFRVLYRGERYTVIIPRDTIDDAHRTTLSSYEERAKMVGARFPDYLRPAERAIIAGLTSRDNVVVLTHDMFPPGFL